MMVYAAGIVILQEHARPFGVAVYTRPASLRRLEVLQAGGVSVDNDRHAQHLAHALGYSGPPVWPWTASGGAITVPPDVAILAVCAGSTHSLHPNFFLCIFGITRFLIDTRRLAAHMYSGPEGKCPARPTCDICAWRCRPAQTHNVYKNRSASLRRPSWRGSSPSL